MNEEGLTATLKALRINESAFVNEGDKQFEIKRIR